MCENAVLNYLKKCICFFGRHLVTPPLSCEPRGVPAPTLGTTGIDQQMYLNDNHTFYHEAIHC